MADLDRIILDGILESALDANSKEITDILRLVVGAASGSAALHLSPGLTPTGATAGIWMGDDVRLYRSDTRTLSLNVDAGTPVLNLHSGILINVADPTNPQEVATKNYVDTTSPTVLHNHNASTVFDVGTVPHEYGGLEADVSAYDSSLVFINSGVTSGLKLNLTATTDPTVDDDDGEGYSILSIWANVTADTAWVCLNDTTGAAVWTEITNVGGLGDMLISTYDPTAVGGDAFAMANMAGTVATAQIADNAVSLPKLVNITENSFLGRDTAGTGNVEVLSAADVRTVLNVADGANAYTFAKTEITGLTTVVPAAGDFFIVSDSSDSDNLKKVNISSIIGGSATYTGDHDFSSADTLVLPTSSTPTVNADGEIALDTVMNNWSHGVVRYYGGEEMGLVALPIADFTSPTDGYVVSYNAADDEFELVAQAGAGTGTFADNVFTLQDNTDNTKEITFEASGITTGTTRALTVQDADGTIAYVSDQSWLGAHDFGGADSLEIPNSVNPTLTTNGEMALDTSVSGFSHGVVKYYSGQELGTVAMPVGQFSSPTDGHVVTYNTSSNTFELTSPAANSGITLDIGNDGGIESTDIGEVATTGDTNSIVTEPTADKILFDMSQNWPAADLASTLASTGVTDLTTIAGASGDFVLVSDTSDSGNLKKVDVDDFLGGGADYISDDSTLTGLLGGTSADLDSITTTSLSVGVRKHVVSTSGMLHTYELVVPSLVTSTIASISTGTDEIALASGDFAVPGQRFLLSTTDTLPTGLDATTLYYVTNFDTASEEIKLATTRGGTDITLSDTGTGTHTITWVPTPFIVLPDDYNSSTNDKAWELIAPVWEKDFEVVAQSAQITESVHTMFANIMHVRMSDMQFYIPTPATGAGAAVVELTPYVSGEAASGSTVKSSIFDEQIDVPISTRIHNAVADEGAGFITSMDFIPKNNAFFVECTDHGGNASDSDPAEGLMINVKGWMADFDD